VSPAPRGGGVIAAAVAVLLAALGVVACSGPPPADAPWGSDPSGPGVSAQDAAEEVEIVPLDIAPGTAREVAIGPGECHVATLELDGDRFVGVEVDQRGADLVTTLREPGGGTTRFDTLTGSHGPEWASFVSERDGAHGIEICLESTGTEAGAYGVRIDAPRAPSPSDRALARGLRRYAAAALAALAGERDAAVEGFEAALRDFESAGAPRPRAWAHRWLAEVEENRGRLEPAERHYARAGEIYETLGDLRQAAVATSHVGHLRSERNDLQGALVAYQRFLRVAERFGDAGLIDTALSNLANAQEKRGRTFEVVTLQHRRRDLAVRTGNVATEWDALTRIGKVYRAGGDDARAFDFFEEALGLARKHRLDEEVTDSLIDQARVRLDRDEPAAARDLLLVALRHLDPDVGTGRVRAEILNNLGRSYARLGQVEAARDHYRRALAAISDDDPEAPVREALALINLAALDGNPPEGEVSCRRALDLLIGAGRAWHATGALRCLAEVAVSRGDLGLAASYLERAVGIVERLRGLSALQELRASFLEDAYAYYERYVEVLRRRHELDPDGGYAARAFGVAERARARLLLDELAGAEAAIRASASPDLLARIEAIERRMSALETELFVTSAGATAAPDGSLQARLSELESEHALVEAEIFAAYPGWPTLLSGGPESVEEIRRSLLSDGATQLVSFFLGEERSFAWILGPSSLVMEVLPGREDIELLARRAASDLRRSDEPHLARRARWSAEALSREVLGPLLPHLTARKLVLVKDGALHYVPFAALPLPTGTAASAGDLIDRYELAEAPSASAAVALRRRRATSRVADLEAAVFADPVFLADDERVAELPGRELVAAARGGGAGSELSRVARSLGPDGLRRLTGSRLEAATISELVPRDRRLVALGFDANRELLLGGTLGRYRILHLAGHGLAHPGFTGLVLSLYDDRGVRVDGLIRSYELYGTELSAELVVLSACSTGLGDEIRGEGLLGLSRGFLYAGASQVLASLWDVDDRATAELMAHFYRALLRDGDPPARALRRAQRALRRDPAWRAPHYWAGFVLQGDGI
jgi:CHAT domain-containing protein/tetratricopeptide (TPR) repeat protein